MHVNVYYSGISPYYTYFFLTSVLKLSRGHLILKVSKLCYFDFFYYSVDR